MMKALTAVIAAASAMSAVTADDFDILQHVGGNGQWFPGMFKKMSDFPSAALMVL